MEAPLRNLGRDGLIARTVYAAVPAKVEYRATDMAVELHGWLTALTQWAERHREAIVDSREAYNREHGRPADLR
ncbi:winged helix-turn-helix transcriptional regulator [Streptomyces sp. NPDC100445]|uniref:winged helix-turn-helix transcriptional regulator n=1 Tax=Streptomyces sp. NPDC100445 TaxID=3366102 RepID=UPI0038177FBB